MSVKFLIVHWGNQSGSVENRDMTLYFSGFKKDCCLSGKKATGRHGAVATQNNRQPATQRLYFIVVSPRVLAAASVSGTINNAGLEGVADPLSKGHR